MKWPFFWIAGTLATTHALSTCDTDRLLSILTGANAVACEAQTGYPISTVSLPTSDTLPRVCANPSCAAYRADLAALTSDDCTVFGVSLKSFFLDKLTAACTVNSETPPLDCSAEQTARVLAVLTTGRGAMCEAETGYSATVSGFKIPTTSSLPVVCINANCQATLSQMKASLQTDCVMLGGTWRPSAYLDQFKAACASYNA